MMKKGWTLIEILMVLLVLGILISILVMRGMQSITNAKIIATEQGLAELKTAIMGDPNVLTDGSYSFKGYYGDLGHLPSSLSDLVNQGSDPSWNQFTQTGWNGPYIQTQGYNVDAWGHPYNYNSTAGTITSAGPDGTFGDSDDIIIYLLQ